MSDGNEFDTEQGTGGNEAVDTAAEAAVAQFWSDNPDLAEGADRSAAKEGASGTENARPGRQATALRNEYADQQMELEQSGELDPAEADGVPAPKQNTPKTQKQAATGKPAAVQQGGETPTETGLDPVLRSIAEDSGWTQEDIDELYETNPEVATRTFERLADQYATMSRQFLNTPGGTQPPATVQAPPAQVQQVQPVTQLPPGLSDEALQKFAEDEGENAANLLKTMRDHFIARDNARETRISELEKGNKQAETRVIAQEATSTLTGLTEKFPTVYGAGDDARTLTLAQYNKRVELASMADQIRAGATAQGRTLSVKDAMLRAHYIVSRDTVKSEARKEITSKVKTRSRQATARPTQRQNPSAAGASRSDEAAIAAAAEKMAEIGINDDMA